MRPNWVSSTLFPFESRFVDIAGSRVHYVDEGQGPVLLLLHGNPTWSFVYREVISCLREEFRCIALDYPSFGLSEPAPGYRCTPEEHAAVTAGFVDQLDLHDITLVVQDWGGPIGLSVAQAQPERFDSLVLANTWAWPVNGDLHFELFSRLMGGPVARELIRRRNLFVSLMIPAGHRLRRLSQAEMDHYRAALSTPSRRHASAVLPHAILASRDFLADVESGLSTLRTLPSLILWGDADVAFRESERRRWQQLLPNHTDVTLAGAGHFVQSDAPQAFAEALRSWWPTRHERRSPISSSPR